MSGISAYTTRPYTADSDHQPDSVAIEHTPDSTTTERVLNRITCRLWKHDKFSEKLWWGCTFGTQIFFVIASKTATVSECKRWVKRVDDTGRPYWINNTRGYSFFEDDEPSEYVIEDESGEEEEEKTAMEMIEMMVDPHTAHDSAWLNPGSILPKRERMCPATGANEPTAERSTMLSALQYSLRNLQERVIDDAPNIGEHIEETFQLLMQQAREN